MYPVSVVPCESEERLCFHRSSQASALQEKNQELHFPGPLSPGDCGFQMSGELLQEGMDNGEKTVPTRKYVEGMVHTGAKHALQEVHPHCCRPQCTLPDWFSRPSSGSISHCLPV
ncbi:hypothetical protein P7K49_040917 [Saguinus oedipus]|uniref:Uncharacterized protein n=1 Tax=Saguinus oedipus TaxID=9490 RepID=A0ABQ9TA69_SAGOE|nr:hypothetical protein P7K49_040917 [Saguinus oedipus]